MGRPKKVIEPEVEPEVSKEEEKTEETPKEETPKLEIAKVYKNGSFVREYSSELHGKSYKKLAEEFANKNSVPEKKLIYEVIVK